MKRSEFRMLITRYGIHREEWRQHVEAVVAHARGWAQVRAFCYGAAFALIVYWVGLQP